MKISAFRANIRKRMSRIDIHDRRLISGAIGLVLSKALSLLILIVTVPVTLHHLGVERFSVWMTLTSLSMLFAASDLGIGNGLMTAIAAAHGRGDVNAIKSLITNSLLTLTIISIVLTLLSIVAYYNIDWPNLFNVSSPEAVAQTGDAVLIFFLCTFLAVPAGIGQRIFTGMQKGYWSGVSLSVASIASFAGLMVGITFDLDLAPLLFCFMGSSLFGMMIMTIVALFQEKRRYFPSLSVVSLTQIILLFQTGIRFLAIALVFATTFTIDNFVVAKMLGPRAVAEYAITDRLFQVIAVAMAMINQPFWPAYANAKARNDSHWILRTFKRSLWLNLIFAGGAALLLVIVAKPLALIWVGASIVPALGLCIAIAVRRLAEALYTSGNMLMNALDYGKIQLSWGIVMAMLSIVLRIYLTEQIGISGCAIAVSLSVILAGFVPIILTTRKVALSCSETVF